MDRYKGLIITEAKDIEENIVNEYSDDKSLEKTEINQEISVQLFNLNSYYSKLVSLIKRDYSDFKNKDYFDKYYCINSKWMSNFLELYKYKKINTLIGEFGINSEEELYQKVMEKKLSLNPNNDIERKESINLRNFEPEKNIISKYTFHRFEKGDYARYFDDFVLVNKEFYDKIKQNDKNKNEVDICLVDDIFIYKVNENVLGIGIPEIKEEILPIFKIQFFIIITEKYIYIDNDEKIIFNFDSEINEIFKCEDLETYLILKREVNFKEQDELKKIDMKFNKNKIGFIYNITDFNIEKYWRRTEEKYNKKMNSKKTLKEAEIKAIEEREKRNNELKKIREIEKRQDEMFKRTKMERLLKEKLKNQLKNGILKNLSKNYLLQKEKEKLKQIKSNNKKFLFNPIHNNIYFIENTRYQENNDLQNQNNGMNNNKNLDKNLISKDKFPAIPKAFQPIILPIIPEKRRSLQILQKKEFYLTFNNNKIKRNVTQEKDPFELLKKEMPVQNSLFSNSIANNKYKTNYGININFNKIILSYNQFPNNFVNRKKIFLKCDNKENKKEEIKEDIKKDKKEDIKERAEKYEKVEEEKKEKEKEEENEEDDEEEEENEEDDEEEEEDEEDDDEEEEDDDDEEEEEDDDDEEEEEDDDEENEENEEDEKDEEEEKKEDKKEEKIKDNKKNKKESAEEKKAKCKKEHKQEDKKKKKKKKINLTKEEKKILKKLRKKMKNRFEIIKKLKEINNKRLLKYYKKFWYGELFCYLLMFYI